MTLLAERPEALHGTTRKIVVETPDRAYRVYVTVNEQDGRPFEIFVRCDHPQLYEWITALTLLITRLLRQGDSLEAIAEELQTIHSGATSAHFLPGGEQCISMVARLGRVLAERAQQH